jgi:hypothetical protein
MAVSGFGPLYNAAALLTQAADMPAIATGGGGAYLGMAKPIGRSHERSGRMIWSVKPSPSKRN